jgi:hypothetical protein
MARPEVVDPEANVVNGAPPGLPDSMGIVSSPGRRGEFVWEMVGPFSGFTTG